MKEAIGREKVDEGVERKEDRRGVRVKAVRKADMAR